MKDSGSSRDHAPAASVALDAAHTPGPWQVSPYLFEDEAPGFSIIAVIPGQDTPTRGQVAFVTTEIGAAFDDVPTARANARLIAAAPDLLAALRAAYYQTYCDCDGLEHPDGTHQPGCFVPLARNAIARATGGEP